MRLDLITARGIQTVVPRTYYDVLGVTRTASFLELRIAYRQKLLIVHPDKGGAAADFQELQEAYEILADSNKRADYNRNGCRPSAVKLEDGIFLSVAQMRRKIDLRLHEIKYKNWGVPEALRRHIESYPEEEEATNPLENSQHGSYCDRGHLLHLVVRFLSRLVSLEDIGLEINLLLAPFNEDQTRKSNLVCAYTKGENPRSILTLLINPCRGTYWEQQNKSIAINEIHLFIEVIKVLKAHCGISTIELFNRCSDGYQALYYFLLSQFNTAAKISGNNNNHSEQHVAHCLDTFLHSLEPNECIFFANQAFKTQDEHRKFFLKQVKNHLLRRYYASNKSMELTEEIRIFLGEHRNVPWWPSCLRGPTKSGLYLQAFTRAPAEHDPLQVGQDIRSIRNRIALS